MFRYVIFPTVLGTRKDCVLPSGMPDGRFLGLRNSGVSASHG